ncbi:hypothetical protein ACHAWC_006751, partial [Mediolabrus comicus]
DFPNRLTLLYLEHGRHIAQLATFSTLQSSRAISDMITLAFFFLLRPGEYVDTNSDSTPFTLADVSLYLGDTYLDLTSATDQQLLTATRVTLTFTTQKNGVRGEVIGLCSSGDPLLCPVRAAARRIIYLRNHNAPPGTPLARLFTQGSDDITSINARNITRTIQQAVKSIGINLGFLPSDVTARSLRAAGANALLLADVDPNIIRLIGRWKSDEMLRYLHVQAAPLMEQYAKKMLHGGVYTLLPNAQHLLPSATLVPLH